MLGFVDLRVYLSLVLSCCCVWLCVCGGLLLLRFTPVWMCLLWLFPILRLWYLACWFCALWFVGLVFDCYWFCGGFSVLVVIYDWYCCLILFVARVFGYFGVVVCHYLYLIFGLQFCDLGFPV